MSNDPIPKLIISVPKDSLTLQMQVVPVVLRPLPIQVFLTLFPPTNKLKTLLLTLMKLRERRTKAMMILITSQPLPAPSPLSRVNKNRMTMIRTRKRFQRAVALLWKRTVSVIESIQIYLNLDRPENDDDSSPIRPPIKSSS